MDEKKLIGKSIFCWGVFQDGNEKRYLIVNMMRNEPQYCLTFRSDNDMAQVFDSKDNPDFIMDEIMMMLCEMAFSDFQAKFEKGVNE